MLSIHQVHSHSDMVSRIQNGGMVLEFDLDLENSGPEPQLTMKFSS